MIDHILPLLALVAGGLFALAGALAFRKLMLKIRAETDEEDRQRRARQAWEDNLRERAVEALERLER